MSAQERQGAGSIRAGARAMNTGRHALHWFSRAKWDVAQARCRGAVTTKKQRADIMFDRRWTALLAAAGQASAAAMRRMRNLLAVSTPE